MARDYQWARDSAGRGMATVGDIAEALHLGRHQARRLLVKADLPGKKKIAKGWRGPNGHWYWRTFWVVPEEALLVLWIKRHHGTLSPAMRYDARFATWYRQRLFRARQRLERRLERPVRQKAQSGAVVGLPAPRQRCSRAHRLLTGLFFAVDLVRSGMPAVGVRHSVTERSRRD